MNCEQAKAISIVDFLHRLGHTPSKKNGPDVWFLSPRRKENTASFHVHTGKNVWCDQGDKVGGTIIDLAIEILKVQRKPHTVSDALQLIENADLPGPSLNIVPVECYVEEEPSLVLSKVGNIKHPALVEYLAYRGIPLEIARLDMKEARIYNKKTKKHFFSLAMKNEDGGYELRNPYFKGCLGPKDITVIRGSKPMSGGLHIFEGSFDYESVLIMNKGVRLRDDAYILHSVYNVPLAIPLIKNYNYKVAYTWLDNDIAGRKARYCLYKFFKTECELIHKPMNKLYMPHKDINIWHMKTLNI